MRQNRSTLYVPRDILPHMRNRRLLPRRTKRHLPLFERVAEYDPPVLWRDVEPHRGWYMRYLRR